MEIALFHPFDTAGKRLMSYQFPIYAPGRSAAESLVHLNQVVCKETATAAFGVRYASLYKGVSAAIGYKVSQRIYRFGGQPFCSEYTDRYYGNYFEAAFGPRWAKTWIHAFTGAAVGVGEVLIVPLDVLKIKRQTNPEALKGRGLLALIRTEGIANLYSGSIWTAARNGPGSFALFGGAALAKDRLFQLQDFNDATWFQNFVAAIVGSFACITIANPLDVIKTRVQNKDFGERVSGIEIIRNMIRNEGASSFFKGFTPKVLIVGPKLIFAYTSANILTQWIEKALD